MNYQIIINNNPYIPNSFFVSSLYPSFEEALGFIVQYLPSMPAKDYCIIETPAKMYMQ